MEETDAMRDQTSKKPSALREDEVRKAASPDLVSWIKDRGENVVTETGACLVIAEIMLYADGGACVSVPVCCFPLAQTNKTDGKLDKTVSINALLDPLCAPYPSSASVDSPHPLDLPHTSRLYKTLLQGGHFNHATQKIDYVPTWDAVRFAIAFVNRIDRDVIVSTCTEGLRGGAFVVAELCSALCSGAKMRGEGSEVQVVDEELEDARDQARKVVKGWFTEDVLELIRRPEEMKGRKVLLEALAKL